MPGDRKWYVVQTYASYEKRVEADLKQRIAAMNMQDKIFNVIVPTETHVVAKDGKSREVTRKLYPSYVMVEMILDEQSWYAVRHTPGVTGFIGAGTHPIPLSQDEVDRILAVVNREDNKTPVEIDLKPGDFVRVIAEGEMKGFTGTVVDINLKRSKVKFKSEMFSGAEFETDYSAIEKI